MPKRTTSTSTTVSATVEFETARALALSLHTVQARAADKDMSAEDISASFVANRQELINQSLRVLRNLHGRGYTMGKADT